MKRLRTPRCLGCNVRARESDDMCRNLCHTCYDFHRRHGNLDAFPRHTWKVKDLLKEVDELLLIGIPRHEIVRRVGIQWDSIVVARRRFERKKELEAQVKEFKNAEETIDAITLHKSTGEGLPRAVYYAPGDMTRYTIALLAMQPLDGMAEDKVLEVLFANSGANSLIIPKPRNEFGAYSAELFLSRFGERYAGWWAGLRPLLAGLGWTGAGDRNTAYSAGDATHMGDALRRRGLA